MKYYFQLFSIDIVVALKRIKASPQLIGSTITILDLSDDCLRELVPHSDTDDLAAVVCARLKSKVSKLSQGSSVIPNYLGPIRTNDVSRLEDGPTIKRYRKRIH